MVFSPEAEDALAAVDERLGPGQRVPDAWTDLPLPLRKRLKETLAGERDIQFELGFAEFVHAYLVVFRQQREASGDDGAERRDGSA